MTRGRQPKHRPDRADRLNAEIEGPAAGPPTPTQCVTCHQAAVYLIPPAPGFNEHAWGCSACGAVRVLPNAF